tara:strand:+ start:407 stop:574 length:168 start_codon:yes stop_codon:yes gene_type:complete
LSRKDEADVVIKIDDKEYTETITRKKFEDLCAPVFEKLEQHLLTFLDGTDINELE